MAEGEKNYQGIIREIGKEKFENRFSTLLQTIDEFLKEGDFSKEIQCNERILYHVILDYFSDIFRLKEFHDIKHTMTVKNISYLMYWFLKRKPILSDGTLWWVLTAFYFRYMHLPDRAGSEPAADSQRRDRTLL